MKKIILVLLVLLMSFSYGKNLNEYESKRVFDKTMDYIITGNYGKYSSDKEMGRILEGSDEAEEKMFYSMINDFVKNNKYEVISVKENKSTSILKVKATFMLYNVSIEDYLTEMYQASQEAGVTEEEEVTNEQIIYIYKKLQEKFKNSAELTEKVIEVYMDKKDGLWDIDNDKNPMLLVTMFPLTDEFHKLVSE